MQSHDLKLDILGMIESAFITPEAIGSCFNPD